MSFYEHSKEIIKFIDSGSWKHSWHLPKDENGYIDWSSEETQKEVIGLIQTEKREAIALLGKTSALLRKLDVLP